MQGLKIIFLGAGDFSTKVFEEFIKKYELVSVITPLDKEIGRGHQFKPCLLKSAALEKGVNVQQFNKVSKEGIDYLKSVQPDLLITAAFGQILSDELLAIPKYGVFNVHASLLPKYRGASPIQAAIINGEKETGITIMKTVKELDAGDIILQDKILIDDQTTSEVLFDKLAQLGSKLLIKAVDNLIDGTITYTKQVGWDGTYCTMIKKTDGIIDFNKTFDQLDCFVRGMYGWPFAQTQIKDKKFKIYKISKVNDLVENEIGTIVAADNKEGILVQCKDSVISLDIVQAENSKMMESKAFMNGCRDNLVGEKL